MSESKDGRFKFRMKKNSLLKKIVIVAVLLFIVMNVLRYAAYFKRDDGGELLVIIQNDDDIELKHDIFVDENDVIYLSEDDVREYFDKDLYYEKDASNLRRYISIAQNKILEITEGKNHMYVNGIFTKMRGEVLERNGVYYFPISELAEVYNIDIEYLKKENRLNIDKLSEEKTTAIVNRDMNLKYKMTDISKNIESLEQGDIVTIIKDMNSKWAKVKTEDYAVGYVKKDQLINISKERSSLKLVSEEFSKFDFNNDIIIEITDETYENFNDRIVDYDSRTKLVTELNEKLKKEISNSANSEKNIGIKINITNVSNAQNYYRFLKELKAYANSNGCFLIVVEQVNLDSKSLKNISNIVV